MVNELPVDLNADVNQIVSIPRITIQEVTFLTKGVRAISRMLTRNNNMNQDSTFRWFTFWTAKVVIVAECFSHLECNNDMHY